MNHNDIALSRCDRLRMLGSEAEVPQLPPTSSFCALDGGGSFGPQGGLLIPSDITCPIDRSFKELLKTSEITLFTVMGIRWHCREPFGDDQKMCSPCQECLQERRAVTLQTAAKSKTAHQGGLGSACEVQRKKRCLMPCRSCINWRQRRVERRNSSKDSM